MKNIYKITSIIISLGFIAGLLQIALSLYIPTPSLQYIDNNTVCTDYCGQYPMYERKSLFFIIVITIIVSIVAFLVLFMPVKKKSKRGLNKNETKGFT